MFQVHIYWIFRIYRKRLVLLIVVTTMRSILTIIGADGVKGREDLFLEELVAHGKEGDGQTRAKEEDEVGRQLVPEFPSCIFGKI